LLHFLRALIAVFAAAASAQTAAPAAISPAVRQQVDVAVAAYNETVAAVRRHEATVEQAFIRVGDLEQLLTARTGDDLSVLDRMTEGELEELARRLPGVQVWRGETEGVAIEPAFFGDLARRFGTDADVQFFTRRGLTYPDGGFCPAYVEQQTDLTGCISYGTGKIVSAYARWSAYQQDYPGHYTHAVRVMLEEATELLTTPQCACGEQAAVTGELALFLRRFRTAGASPKAARLLDAVRAGKSGMRFKCEPR
jgi:hypothetical protein